MATEYLVPLVGPYYPSPTLGPTWVNSASLTKAHAMNFRKWFDPDVSTYYELQFSSSGGSQFVVGLMYHMDAGGSLVAWSSPPHNNAITAATLKIDWEKPSTTGGDLNVMMSSDTGDTQTFSSAGGATSWARKTTSLSLSNAAGYGTNWDAVNARGVRMQSASSGAVVRIYRMWLELTTSSTTPVLYLPWYWDSYNVAVDTWSWSTSPAYNHALHTSLASQIQNFDIDSSPSIDIRGLSTNNGITDSDVGLRMDVGPFRVIPDANADASWRMAYYLFGHPQTNATHDDPFTIDFWDYNGAVSKENMWDTATDGWVVQNISTRPVSGTWNWLTTWNYNNPEQEYGFRIGGSNDMAEDAYATRIRGMALVFEAPQVDLNQDQYQFFNSGNTASIESLTTALTYTGAEGAQSITLRLRWTENATTHGKFSCPEGGFLLQYRLNAGAWTDVPTTGNLSHRSDTWDDNPNTGPASTDSTWGAMFEHARTTNLGMDRLFTVNQQGGTNKVRVSVAYGLSITPSAYSTSDTIEFRIKPTSMYGLPLTETETPTINIGGAGAQTINANSVADAATVPSPQIQNLLSIVNADSVADAAAVSTPQVAAFAFINADSVADSAAVGTPQVNDLNVLQITSVSIDDVLYSDETNWVIEGGGFGATQGLSKVYLNTASTKNGNEVEQNVTSWTNNTITMTDVTVGSLGAFAPAYVLVEKI